MPQMPRMPMANRARMPMAQRARMPVARGARMPMAQRARMPVSQGARMPVAQGARMPMAQRARMPISTVVRQPLPRGMPRQRGQSERGHGQRIINVSEGVLNPVLQRNLNDYREEDEDDPSYNDGTQQRIYEPQGSFNPTQTKFPRQRGRGGRVTSQQNSHMRQDQGHLISQGAMNNMNYGEEEEASKLYDPEQGIYDPQSSIMPIQQRK